MLMGMDYIIDRYQALDDAVHEAHEAIHAHIRRVAVAVRGDEPAPRTEPITKEWRAEYDRLREAERDAIRARDEYARTIWGSPQ